MKSPYRNTDWASYLFNLGERIYKASNRIRQEEMNVFERLPKPSNALRLVYGWVMQLGDAIELDNCPKCDCLPCYCKETMNDAFESDS